MPFQKGHLGNPMGHNGKPFRDALRMELAAAGDDHKELRAIAANLIKIAKLGETSALPAIKEVADRTDGKVAQPVGGTDELPPQAHVHKIERVIVDPTDTDSPSIQAVVITGEIQGS